ncbi:MAG: hypothetical protein ICV31_01345 [Rubrobacter sp.]|nr:hypothetical protein [Rubrobacter sp.]
MGKDGIQIRWFEAGVVLAGIVAFGVLGPLRGAFAAAPGVLLLATLILFLVPGTMLARWLWDEYFSGAALAPVAFVTSVGLFALSGVPMLIMQSTMGAYLRVCAAIVALSLLAAAVAAFRPERPVGEEPGFTLPDRGGLLWAPFVALVATLAYIARTTAPSIFGDIWIYLSWVREYLGGDRLASSEPFFGGEVGLSRAKINGWILEQAGVAKVSGVDPVNLVFSYLNPALVVVAFLVFYALARVLFKSERAALFSGCLYALFFLIHLSQSRVTWGGEFVQRLPEDKLVAKFLFFPLALAFAYAFLDSGKKRYFWGFAFLCATVIAIHPIGLAIIGISMAGVALMHLAAEPRSLAGWARIAAMGVAGVAIIAVPAGLATLFTDEPLSNALADSDINSGDPDVLRNMIFVSPERNRILELADGSFIMHPSLLLDPVIATAFLVGLPFLLWRLGRSLAARLLLGTLYVTMVVVYVPPIATFLGDNVVLPGQIWRLAWPIQFAALLALGWSLWAAIEYVAERLAPLGPGRYLARALPLLLVLVLVVAAIPQARPGWESIAAHREASRESGYYPSDPIYPWFRDEVRSPVIVMAPDLLGARIPAYSAEANVVSRRGSLVLRVLPELKERAPGRIEVPQGSLDVRDFYSGATLQKGMDILRRNQVDYVMAEKGSSLAGSLDRLPAFTLVDTPSIRYDLYAVDLAKLPK